MKKLIIIKLIYAVTLAIFYLSSTQLNMMYAQTNTVCDNGGFEQDFLYYTGEIATFKYGSNDCNPLESDTVTPVTFSSASLPLSRRFEIVSSGIDSLVGIQKTKFGSKALRLNSRFGHSDDCSGNRGVDRITKEFTVTEDFRNFTVWYALVLENPGNHDNFQPFFSIKCNLAPADELCFDAAILNCEQAQMDSICPYRPLDVLNWTCHRFRIPKSEIGNTATLEITVADCGAGAHFGYAYIDGICEDCDSSALGSVSLDQNVTFEYCQGDTATICGSYSLPSVCNQAWELKELIFPGYTIANLVIDSINHTFCFDFPKSNFTTQDCIDVYVQAIFKNNSDELPSVNSNAIEVCKDSFYIYSYEYSIGSCSDNGTSDNISDDYYYVYLNLDSTAGKDWTIDRLLYDPYPNEIDEREIANGIGNQNVILGPFRIQEGDWKMTITFNNDTCVYEEDIIPPDYCSGCNDLRSVDISNIQCIATNPDDKWSFDIFISGDPTKQYTLTGSLGALNLNFNIKYTITSLTDKITPNCFDFTISGVVGCDLSLTICPPKPCSNACYLEVYEKTVTCTLINNVITYTVELEASGPTGKYLCYAVNGTPVGLLPNPQILGPYNQDIEITISLCDDANCSSNCTSCYKTIYVPLPDCNQPSPLISGNEDDTSFSILELRAYPNPMHSDELILESKLVSTEFEIWDAFGRRIVKDSFRGQNYRINLNESSGLYLLRYKNSNGDFAIIKVIKL